MNCLLVFVLAACVAMAASAVHRPSQGGNIVDFEALGVAADWNAKVELTKVGKNTRLQRDQSGMDSRFNGQNPSGGELRYNFKPDFEQLINPRNFEADWRWLVSSGKQEIVFSSGAFLRDAQNTIDLVALPMHSFMGQDNTRLPPIHNRWEAAIVSKQNFSVGQGQELVVNVKFACRVFNSEDQPFPAEAVSKEEDDPTLAHCGVGVASYDKSALIFNILATSNGIWMSYARNRVELLTHPERNHKEFSVFHRLASRQTPYDLIDATIKYDREKGRVEFIIGGEVMYTLNELGTLTHFVNNGNELDKAYEQVYTLNRADLVREDPKDFQVFVAIGSYPSATDPNNPGNPPLRKSKLTTDGAYYDEKAKFFDNEGKKEFVYWGQGASMTLQNIKIKLGAAGSDRSSGSIISQVENRRPRGWGK